MGGTYREASVVVAILQDLTPLLPCDPVASLRGLLAANEQLARELKALEKRLSQKLDTHDQAITGILNTLRALMQPPTAVQPVKRPIGFVHHEEKKPKASKR